MIIRRAPLLLSDRNSMSSPEAHQLFSNNISQIPETPNSNNAKYKRQIKDA
jgi:hypothetical protein